MKKAFSRCKTTNIWKKVANFIINFEPISK